MDDLHRFLFDYVNTLEVEYIGARAAKIKIAKGLKLKHIEDKIRPTCSMNGYRFAWINDFNSNGIYTTATIRLLPESIKTFPYVNTNNINQP